jgi:hypothetical protein
MRRNSHKPVTDSTGINHQVTLQNQFVTRESPT